MRGKSRECLKEAGRSSFSTEWKELSSSKTWRRNYPSRLGIQSREKRVCGMEIFRSVWWNLLTKISSARLIEKKHCNWKEIFLLGLNSRKPFVYIRSKPVNRGGRFIQKHFRVWKETCWIYFLFRLLKPFHCGIISPRLNVHSVFYFFSTLLACYEKGRHFIRY